MTMPIVRPEGALSSILVSSAGRIWVDAGRLCVDFAMTGPWPEAGSAAARWEGVHEPSDLADWFTACELELAQLAVGPSDLASALELRAGLWGLTRAAIEGRPRPRDGVATVNSYARATSLAPQLGSPGRRWSSPTAVQALANIARDAVELHGDPVQLRRLRECASDDCPRVFFDASRPGTRRWCDAVRCGDRQRARAYRRSRTHGPPRTDHQPNDHPANEEAR